MIKAPDYSLRFNNEVYFNPIAVGSGALIKTAADKAKYSPEVADFAGSIKEKDGVQSVLINAVSSYEYWSCNINADAFKEEEFVQKKRHETFTTHAHPYKNHVNKDPKLSYGRVLFAAFNPRMHRVELICEFDRAKADDICDRIDRNEDVRVSMGCKVAYDVCSICGNKAKTTADYCDHLKYEMKKIYPDGRIVCAFNPDPTFFDISVVWVPADKTARVMKKIASVGTGLWLQDKTLVTVNSEERARMLDITDMDKAATSKIAADKIAELAKRAVQAKQAEIEKKLDDAAILGHEDGKAEEAVEKLLPDLRKNEPDIPNEKLDSLAENHSMEDIIGSLGMLGIMPKPREFQRLMLVSGGNKGMADMLDDRGMTFEPEMDSITVTLKITKSNPSMAPSNFGPERFISSIIPMLGNLIGDKSYFGVPVTRRIIRLSMGPTKMASDESKSERSSIASTIGSLKGYLASIAAAYLATKTGLMRMLETVGIGGGAIDKLFAKNPEAAAALLGAGGIGLASLLKSNEAEPAAYPSDYLYTKDSYKEKSASLSVGNMIPALIAPQLATHFVSGYMTEEDREAMRMGQEADDNFIREAIKTHPGTLGLLFTAAGLKNKWF